MLKTNANLTPAQQRRIARRYWRARAVGRRLQVEATRQGISISTLAKYGRLYPETLIEIRDRAGLTKTERTRLEELINEHRDAIAAILPYPF